jgi:hypothetical protein
MTSARRSCETTMKYCYECNRITTGDPLFCNFCGRSYDVKLCPRLHPNPRIAQTCSQCGNRDLSTPQPKVPLWARIILFFLPWIPGTVLTVLSVGAAIFCLNQILHSPRMMMAAFLLLIALGFLWWVWAQLPLWFRKAIYRLLKHRRDGHGPRDED